MARSGRTGCAVVLATIFLALGIFIASTFQEASPLAKGPNVYLRFESPIHLNKALERLESEHIVRNAFATKMMLNLRRVPTDVSAGTYQFHPGMTTSEIAYALKSPVNLLVRIPEGWWIARVASRLEEKSVCSAQDYIDAAKAHGKEGMLFPDTYNIPPLTPAEKVVEMQMQTFEKKVMPILPAGADLKRILTIASLVELEASGDSDREHIAGIIENRLQKNMRLEIDATVLYALQKWQVLRPGVVKTVPSPYNTYLHFGLPPGPIGSPGLKSIKAAIHPLKTDDLYYVADGKGHHLFAKTYAAHILNIKKVRHALASGSL